MASVGADVMAGCKRVVVKVGSSSLATTSGDIAERAIAALTSSLAAARGSGQEVVLVSSGAIASGLAPLGLSRRPRDLARQQAAASVGQGLLIRRYAEAFAHHGLQVGQVLLTVDDMVRRAQYRNAHRTFATLLEMGVVPVVNENDTVATGEIRFGDNDRLAALVAHLVHADALVLLSDIDGVYDRPPGVPGSRRLQSVRGPEDFSGIDVGPGGELGTGGIATKVEAARIAAEAGIPAVVAHASDVDTVLAGNDTGTWFPATGKRRATRLSWLAYIAEPKGELVLDEGAVNAVTKRGSSLLPAGVVGVGGHFTSGDPVDLVNETGAVVARGLINYDAEEVPALLGQSTKQLAATLGPGYERELVHRDGLVVFHGFAHSPDTVRCHHRH